MLCGAPTPARVALPACPRTASSGFLYHSGGDITDHYIRDSALGQLQLAEQETISAYIIKALAAITADGEVSPTAQSIIEKASQDLRAARMLELS
jgi:hypothetical protein